MLTQNSKDPTTEQLLAMLRDAGFQTTRGSNTYVLANVISDFLNKAVKKRFNDIGSINLWDSNDLSVIVPILFDRYRIYNERHQPKKYDISLLGQTPEETKDFTQVKNNRFLINLNNQGVLAKLNSRVITYFGNDEPIRLGVKYDRLLADSQLVLTASTPSGTEQIEFFESFMSATGVYIEKDYVILPDTDGVAVFYPITDFKRVCNDRLIQPKSMKLVLLEKPNEPDYFGLSQISSGTEVTPDFLKFVLTQAMSKFAMYRGIETNELVELIKQKYQNPRVNLKHSNNEITIDLLQEDIREIQQFADQNTFTKVKISKPREVYTNIVPENLKDQTLSLECLDFLASRLNQIETETGYKQKVYTLVDQFYANKFGLDANIIKSQRKLKIEISYQEIPEYAGDGNDILSRLFVKPVLENNPVIGCGCGESHEHHEHHEH